MREVLTRATELATPRSLICPCPALVLSIVLPSVVLALSGVACAAPHGDAAAEPGAPEDVASGHPADPRDGMSAEGLTVDEATSDHACMDYWGGFYRASFQAGAAGPEYVAGYGHNIYGRNWWGAWVTITTDHRYLELCGVNDAYCNYRDWVWVYAY